jgi:hypothetical protein
MKKVTLILAITLMLFLTGCTNMPGDTNRITGNAVKEVKEIPAPKLDPTGREVCGSYSESFKKIGECLGDLERSSDGNYYCEGSCGFDYTCFRDKRIVPCPTE